MGYECDRFFCRIFFVRICGVFVMWCLFFDGNYRFGRKFMGIGLNVNEWEGLERFHKFFCGKGYPML